MADEQTCPHCGKPVPPTAMGGICPACMLKAGLAGQTEGPDAGPSGAKAVPPPLQPAEIAALFPQLEIIEYVGRGGMGVVYKARQPRLNRLVALKILAREREQNERFAERFTREAQVLARLNHPNIVAVYDFGEAGGYYYLLMEFVDGLSLRQLLQTEKMNAEQALTIVPKICEALQYAHEQGVVHRDIKPENILLDKQGRLKIADFGIAKMVGAEARDHTLTGAKDIVGTPHYMAPEQIEKPLEVDHRADIYSLGVVFYEMLTGELPLGKFAAPSRRVQMDVRLDEVVLRTLEKEPALRYQQAGQLKTAVETISSGAPTPSAPAGPPPAKAAPVELSPQPPDRFWKRFAAVAALGLIVIPMVIVIGINLSKIAPVRNRAGQQPNTFVRDDEKSALKAAGPSLSEGLVAHWSADGNARDAVSDNDGVPVGNVRFSPGISGQAFKFDGRGAYVRIRSPLNFKIEDQVTIAFWMKADADNTMRAFQGLVTSDFYDLGLANYAGTMGINFGISTTENEPPQRNGITTRSNFTSTLDENYNGASVTPGVWYHIAGTYDGARLQLYLNGSAWGQPVFHTGRIREMLPGSFIAIGSEDGRMTCPSCIGQQYFKGLIEEVRIYNRALPADEIERLFRAVNPGDSRPGRSLRY
jgi:serine/threonine protein kinase